jgi:hypothetical protein
MDELSRKVLGLRRMVDCVESTDSLPSFSSDDLDLLFNRLHVVSVQ